MLFLELLGPCSELTIKTPEECLKYVHRFVVFIVNFEHISHLFHSFSIDYFGQVSVC